MHFFKDEEGQQVDLDDPKTYESEFWKKYTTAASLYELARCELGEALYYIEFSHPDSFVNRPRDDCGYRQVERIRQYCFWFAQEWNAHLTDTEENRMWFRKFIYMFQDETENLC